jgi:hypothetical protein
MSEPASLPLLELCRRHLHAEGDGRYLLDSQGEAALVEGLIAFRDDPRLAEGVQALFEAATTLFNEHQSPDAAAAILRALHRARPKLQLREQAAQAIQAAHEGGLAHVVKQAPTEGATAPEGSIKAHRFANPGRTRG